MASQTASAPFSVVQEILQWSANRPEWQRDALRRIIASGQLAPTDMIDLDLLCRSKHGALEKNEQASSATPLSKHHIPTTAASTQGISLVSLGKLQQVNRLSSNETLIFGSAPGLTVIYGENGAGKSGYARVIKKACRARGHSAPILPNVNNKILPAKASADFVIREGGVEHTINWREETPGDVRLGHIFLFDAYCAEHYVQEDAGAIFTPLGLDILGKLSNACDGVRANVNARRRIITDQIAAVMQSWKMKPNTAVGKLVAGLSAKTKEADLDLKAVWSDVDTKRLAEVREALSADPKIKAVATRASSQRVRTFREQVEFTLQAMDDSAIASLHFAIQEANVAQEAVQMLSTKRFDETFLPGTGNAVWKLLWEAARAYSVQSAYGDKEFPVTEDGARCVLCQSPLDSDAQARLKRFDEFVRDNTSKLAKEKTNDVEALEKIIYGLPALEEERKKIDGDLAAAPQQARDEIDLFVATADLRLVALRKARIDRDWNAIPAFSTSPVANLKMFEGRLTQQASTETTADDPVQKKKLSDELDELEDRHWLFESKHDVLLQVGRYKAAELLQKCGDDTQTSQITAKTTELTKAIVTDTFCKRFATEVEALGMHTLKVELQSAGGQKGVTRFGVRLSTASSHGVAQVASEGEKRCIALGLFLAELSQASHQSTLVFDDPVSSLDHRHRELIAKRLTKESRTRQVIVYTHDSVFLHELTSFASKEGIPVHLSNLQWLGDTPGHWVEGLPWKWKSPGERFDSLMKDQQAIAKTCSVQPTEEDEDTIRAIYSRLKATLERMVEHDIFADSVFRFRTYIDVKKVSKVVGFPQTEFDELERLFKRCCDVTDAHDPAQGQHATVPTPAELAKDISDAKTLLETIRKRHNQP